MTIEEAVKHLESWARYDEYPNLAVAIETVLAEMKRLTDRPRCSDCAYPVKVIIRGEMTADELAAIKERMGKRREIVEYLDSLEKAEALENGTGWRSTYRSGPVRQDVADFDALIAEVERLQMHWTGAGQHECPACGLDHTVRPAVTLPLKTAGDWRGKTG